MPTKSYRFLDPLSDFGFKRLFGTEKNKDILIAFLNALFLGEQSIRDVVFSPTEHNGSTQQHKKVFFDLMCTGVNGELFVIEMQRAEQHYFKDRAVYYTARLINDQLQAGADHWKTGLKHVYMIAIMEFGFKDSKSDQCFHKVVLSYHDTGQIFYDKLTYKFVELSKFNKAASDICTDLEKWTFLLKNMKVLDEVPEVLNHGIYKKVFEISEINKLNKEDKQMWDSNLKAKWDYENTIEFAADKAREEGVKEGLIEGKESEKRKLACIMKYSGEPLDKIQMYTDLPYEVLTEL